MTADDEFDEHLRARVRDHFERAAAAHAVPAFDAMLAEAESGARSSPNRRRWAIVGALAASLAVAVALQLKPEADAPLIAELSATTHWTAPSDRWPTTRSADYLGLPRFDDMNTDVNEVPTWF